MLSNATVSILHNY
jgi:PH domain